MKCVWRFLIAALFTAAASSVQADVNPSILGDKLTANAAECGRFEQSRQLADLNATLKSHGVYRRHGDELVWTTLAPIREQVVLAPDSPDLQPEMKAMLPIFSGLLSGDWASLERHFSVDLSGSLDDWNATLKPREAVVAERLSTITVNGGQHIEALSLSFADGDELMLSLTPLSCQSFDDGKAR